MLHFDIITRGGTNFNSLVVLNKLHKKLNSSTLIDAGASVPVWCGGDYLFKLLFKDARDSGMKMYLGGFGENYKVVPVWIIPKFVLSDGENTITFPDLYVALDSRRFTFSMVMSFKMLMHANVHINCKDTSALSVDIDYDTNVIETYPVTRKVGEDTVLESIEVGNQNTVTLAQSPIRCTRTLDELLSDNTLFLKADERHISMVNLYSVLPNIVKDMTDLTDKEILDKVETALIVNGF